MREVDKWDISQLLHTSEEFFHTENYLESDERELENFFSCKPEGKEDIFSFISRLDKFTEIDRENGSFSPGRRGDCHPCQILHGTLNFDLVLNNFPEYKIFLKTQYNMLPPARDKTQLQREYGHNYTYIHANIVPLTTLNTQNTQHNSQRNKTDQ